MEDHVLHQKDITDLGHRAKVLEPRRSGPLVNNTLEWCIYLHRIDICYTKLSLTNCNKGQHAFSNVIMFLPTTKGIVNAPSKVRENNR